jgi:hypothetical protein
MARSRRITFSIDADIYDYAVERAARRQITLAEQIRWITRDGVAHRLQLEHEYRRLAAEESKHGW